MTEKTTNMANNKLPWPKTGEGPWFLDKQKVGSPMVQPSLDPSCEFRQSASMEHAKTRLLENNRKSFHGSKVCNDDELVRHMSNLPGFLQKVEKGKSVQEKALNFGVLDWKQLEKWKYNERVPGKCHRKASSSSRGYVCMETGPPKMGPYLKKQYSSNGLNPSVVSMGKLPIPYSRFSSPHKKPPTAHISSSSSTKEVRNETHQRKENFCDGEKTEMCDQEYEASQSGSVDRHQNFHQRVENNYSSFSETTVNNCPRKDTKKKNAPENKALSIELEQKLSLPKSDMVNGGVKKSEMGLIGVESNPQHLHVEPLPQDVLLMPKHHQTKSCWVSSQLSESGAKGKRFSDLSTPHEFGGLSVKFPSSCSLPAVDVHAESSIESHNMVTSRANEVDIYKDACPEPNPVASVPSEGRCKITHEKTTRSTLSVKSPKTSEADIAKQPPMKGRHLSPTRWFGFGKMNKSSYFKEMSKVPQQNSTYAATKSGPVTESSSGMSKFDQDKANSSNRGKSSPLRRLLDPLIKYKGSQSTKIVQPPTGLLSSMTSGTRETLEPSQGREPEGVTGLLQLTLKNGLPFFKLVVEHSCSHMLAAIVKRLPSNEKNSHCMIFAFYSVHEKRKKSMTWTQGSKNKSCGLDYKIVGQMKISSFYAPKLHAKDSSHCTIRECVLYGVDRQQQDKQAPELLSDMEIAAVVLKSSCQNLNAGHLNDDQKPYRERGLPQCVLEPAFDMGGNENSISAAVILPSSVHGNPSKGAPSSLISRWRSGGSCDCGGWDVGCKIRVLTNFEKNGMFSEESVSSCAIGRVNLFLQGGERKSKPVLNLESFDNGLYSLRLDPSIPFLEAFATCVAFITSQKFSEILDKSSQEKVLEAIIGKKQLKTATTFQGQIPAKYVSCPPPSPVGRI